MSRVIKFRGKKLLYNEWIEGYLISTHEIRVFITGEWEGQYEDFLVDPSTVVQFTGLTNKNGKEIYEGDVITSNKGNMFLVSFGHYNFKGTHYGWFIKNGKHVRPLNKNMIIIGNIHENPELLTAKA